MPPSQPPEFSILHLDDDQIALDEFEEFVSGYGEGRFRLVSVRFAEQAIRELEQNVNINLCIVDNDLSQVPKDYSRQIWNGLTFVSYAKIVSSNTSFILLTNSANITHLKREAAKVGCLDVIGKRRFRRGDLQRTIEQLESACLYSKYFIAEKSDARLNFSESVAHSLRSSLSTQRQSLEILRDDLDKTASNFSSVSQEIDQVTDTLREIDSKLTRLLQFYGYNKVNYQRASFFDVIRRATDEVGLNERVRISGPRDLVGTFDVGLMQQAIENILENSKKSIDEHPEGEVIVELRPGQPLHGVPFVQISVADNGVGLKPNTRHLITQPTRSFDNLKKGIVSFGLGASEAKKILRMHRVGMICGSFEIDDRKDCRGCEVLMNLPRDCTD